MAFRVALYLADAVEYSKRRPGNEKAFIRTVRDMADLARGATKPGETFGVDISDTVWGVEHLIRPAPDRYAEFKFYATVHPFASKLLEGLKPREAKALVETEFAMLDDRKRKPVGIVVDMLHAAVVRGVDFGRGAGLGRSPERPVIAKLVNESLRRQRNRSG